MGSSGTGGGISSTVIPSFFCNPYPSQSYRLIVLVDIPLSRTVEAASTAEGGAAPKGLSVEQTSSRRVMP